MVGIDAKIDLDTIDISFEEDETGISSFIVGLFTEDRKEGSVADILEVSSSPLYLLTRQLVAEDLGEIEDIIAVYCKKKEWEDVFEDIRFSVEIERGFLKIDFNFFVNEKDFIPRSFVVQ